VEEYFESPHGRDVKEHALRTRITMTAPIA
jgi:hypothetical protein